MTVTYAVEPVPQPWPHTHAGPAGEAPVPPDGASAVPPEYAGVPYAGVSPTVAAPSAFTRFFLRLHARTPRWTAPAAVAACFAGAASLVWVTNPTDGGADAVPTCLIKMTTGFDCPGCGGTRAFYYLMHGNIPEAARHHAIAVFAAPFLVWMYLAWTMDYIFKKKIPAPKITAKTISFFLAVWAVFMIVRNIPIAPFTSLYV
jgi:Protein of unknown function (DUF2752)